MNHMGIHNIKDILIEHSQHGFIIRAIATAELGLKMARLFDEDTSAHLVFK